MFQVLRQKKDPSKFYVYYKWGRVGLAGDWMLRGTFNEEKAIEAYRAKQKEKGCGGKYTTLEMSYLKDGSLRPTLLINRSRNPCKSPSQES